MRTSGTKVSVVGVGARTPVGMSAPGSAAAVRAGVIRVCAHPFQFDGKGEPLHVARASYLPPDLAGSARLAALAVPAAAEAMAPFLETESRQMSVPLFLGLPSALSGRPSASASVITEQLTGLINRGGCTLGDVRLLDAGHASGMLAIHEAFEAISMGRSEIALAGGVESYLEPETLEALVGGGKVHRADENPWGFVPGEASGFVLLTSSKMAQRLQISVAVHVVASAATHERKLDDGKSVCLGEGLTELFRRLGDKLTPGFQIARLIGDMNGEPYRADEFGFATLRTGGMFGDAAAVETPATSWGDVGAASGPLFVALADAGVRRGYGGSTIAAFTSAASGERCGIVLQSYA